MNWKNLARRNALQPQLSSKRRPRQLLAECLEERRLLAAVVRSGAGASPVDLQPVVDQFRADLGDPVNGAAPGSAAAGRREINWDGVPDAFAAPSALPGDFFNANSPRGVIFETLGSGFSVSAKADNPTTTPVRFGDINAAYETQFQTFSAERLFTAVGSNVMEVRFVVPGTALPATVRGFGAVFADVDIAGGTSLEFFDAAGQSLGAPIVADTLDNGLSFLGATFDAGERIAKVRITSGTVALGAGANDGGADDVVVMDDFLYAEPQGLGTLFLVDASNQLVRLNANDPGAVGVTTPIAGLQVGEAILGIDFRPATGELYAIGSTNQLYTINTSTGAATAVGGALSVPLAGDSFGIDFNPAVDRLRVVSNSEQNLRINPITGALVAEDTPLNPDGNIVAAAYANNGPAATVTTLFGLDSDTDSLVRIGGVDGAPSPNGGEVTTIGPLGVDFTATAGFDIAGGSGVAYAALTVEGTVRLYSIDLTTGGATAVSDLRVTGTVRGLAVAIPPKVQITASTLVVEEDAGTKDAVLTVTLSEAATTAVTVDFATQDDTAIAGTDYDAVSGTLTFPAGSTSQEITVPVRGDLTINGNRTFKVVLSNVSAGAVAQTTEGVVTILDNDDPEPVAVDDEYDASEDAALSIEAPGLLANDTNAQTVTAADDTSTLGAAITFNADGSFTYDPTGVALIQALAAGETAEDTFSYTASDLEGNTATATVRINLTGVNDAPVAVNDDYSENPIFLGDEIEIMVIGPAYALVNDSDPEGDTLTLSGVAPLSAFGAAVRITDEGLIEYNPRGAAAIEALSVGQELVDSFEYTISDGNGGTATATFTIKLLGLNDPPIANDDAFSTDAETPRVITFQELTSDDVEIDQQDVLVISEVSATSAKGAVVTLNGDGSVTYDPTGVAEFQNLQLGQSTTDTFTYTISDGQGGTDTATVTMLVSAANHAPAAADDTANATADVPLNVPAPGVLANDTDPDAGDALAVVEGTLTSARGAAVTINADGGYTYDGSGSAELIALPEGATVDDTFTYTVRDAGGLEDTATVTITVTGVNDPPVAGNLTGAATEDAVLPGDSGALLVNASDPDTGDTVTAVLATFTTPLGATMSILENGGYFYDPRNAPQIQALQAGETLDDTFEFTIKDAAGLTATGTITITVQGANDAPVATDDAADAFEDQMLNVSIASGVLSNDNDADTTETLTAVAGTFTSARGATITLREDGSYDYDPTLANTLRTLKDGETIEDTFQYTVRDAAGAEDTGTVTVTVTGVAADTTAPQFTISTPSVVEGNDGQAVMEFTVTLEFASLQTITMNYATADGTATVAGNDYLAASGALTFTPGALTQTFTVQVLGDTTAESNETITVNITDAVNTASATGASLGTILDDDNQPPTAVADAGATNEDTVLTVNDPLLIANDTDPDNHVPLTAVAETVTSAQGATVTINADGSYSYDPTAAAALQGLAAGETIDDTFTYQVQDSLGATSTGTVTITVTGVNDAPTAADDEYETTEDDELIIAAPGILLNDQDVDGDTLTIIAPTESVLGAPITVNQDGSFIYDPRNLNAAQLLAAGETVVDEFAYTIEDGQGGSAQATVSITLTGVNDNPIADADAGDVNEDAVLDVPAATGLLANDSDVDAGTTLTVEAATLTSTLGAAVTINADGSYSYDPRSSLTLRTLGIGETVDDTFTYKLLDGDGGEAIGTVSITVTGTTDDGVPKITIADVSQVEGDAGEIVFTFTVSLDFASLQAVTVDFATADGGGIDGATAGEDYIATSGTITFPVGVATRTIEVIVLGDTKLENNETLLVNLTNAVGGEIDVNQAVGTITNDDPTPTITIADAAVAEGNSGTTNLTFTVTLSNPSENEITVDFTTANGTAEAGTDFVERTGTLTFAPGETTQTIVIVVNGDETVEPNELFLVTLSNASGATIDDGTAEGQITNDDGITISIGDATVAEGNSGETDLVFTVTLSQAVASDTTVDFATAAGTALASVDFVTNTGTLTIPAGETTGQIVVKVLGDLLDEADETFSVVLSNPATGTTIADGEGLGTITDDDEAPTISIADVSAAEGDSGTTDLVFTVTLSAASGQSVTVDFATADGTAVAGTDYTAATGTITFEPGQTSKTITVQATGDTTAESDETFLVNLTNATNATIQDAQAQGTIEDDDAVAATLSINDVSVNETDSGTVEMTFTVTLSAAQSQDVTVEFDTADGTAVAPGDYTAQSGTLTIPAGQTTRTITIIVASDVLDEADETLTVTLSNPSNGVTLADATGTGTINDNDPAPLVSINDATVTEGNSGTVDMVFTVTLSAASGQQVTVPFSLVGETATLGSDFEDQSGTLTFAPGELTKTITVKVIGDTIDEPSETLRVSLGAPTNASLTDGVGIGTITDDDPAAQGPTLSIGDASIVEGNSGQQNLVFTVTLSEASTQTVTVNFATANGSATAGNDYTTTNGTLTFEPGQTSRTISVPILGDTNVEPHETFTVTLSNPSTGVSINDGAAIGTITNDDGTVNMSISDATVNEGNTGTTNAVFTVTLSAASSQTVTVNFATSAGTATAGTDFVATSGTLTFAPGETTKTINVVVNGDTLDEANETFAVVLTNVANATLLDDTGAGSITDDDAPPTISIADQSVAEGNSGTTTMTFTVTLSAASGLPVTVNFATAGGTATSGTDFVAGSGQVTVPAGQTSATFTVTINGDTVVEPNETFTVTLSNPTNATIADGTATGTITDDDSAVTISIADATVTEGDSGTTTVTFTVTLSGPSGQTVTVNFATADGTATQPGDYTQASGTLTFAPGETSKTITVTIAGDSLDEADETFTVNLTSPSGATISDGTATGTITDNDTAGTVQFSNAVFTVNENGGSITITVTRTGGTAANATVNFATSNGTATAGSDYTTASGTLTILAGETSKTFTISILNDAALENLETINLTLSSPGGGATLGAQSTAVVNINDDDGNPNERFVNNLYEDLLGRGAERQGLDFYVDLIQRGRSRGDIAFMIQHSQEHRIKLVNDLYQELLGRAADAAGLDLHTRLLARGKTVDDVRASILASDEFFSRRGGGTNEGFVNALYQAVLNRTADATGREIYVGALNSGGSRAFVAKEVLKSIEADRRLSAVSYTKYLGRAADTAGNEFQASAFNRGYEQRVLAGILASDEYFSKL